jgi:hypothetical protein
MTTLGPEFLTVLQGALIHLNEESSRLLDHQGREFAENSQVAKELETFSPPELIRSACYFGTTLLDFGSEHISALVKLLVEPIEVIVFWTTVRSMLESCSIATWLLDPAIDARTRAGRVFTLRYDEMDKQATLLRTSLKGEVGALQRLLDRMDEVEQTVLNLGYPRLRDKNGKRFGFVQKMPSATDIIEMMLHDAWSYRMLSAVAHGHSWAIRGLGWSSFGPELLIQGVSLKQLEKTVNPDAIAIMGLSACKALARPLWNLFRFYGWDSELLTGLLEDVFDRITAQENQRFWRT